MTVSILDTDHASLLKRGHPVTGKILSTPPVNLAITIVSYEEQVQERLAQIRKSRNLVEAYYYLHETLDFYRRFTVLSFDEVASRRFYLLQAQKLQRIGTLDLRLAAIVLSVDGILITRNERDFAQVPGLVWENWADTL